MRLYFNWNYFDSSTLFIFLVIWGGWWWSVWGRLGFKGNAQWLLAIGALFPPTLVGELIYLCLVPFPLKQQVSDLKKQIEQLKRDLDVERDFRNMGNL